MNWIVLGFTLEAKFSRFKHVLDSTALENIAPNDRIYYLKHFFAVKS